MRKVGIVTYYNFNMGSALQSLSTIYLLNELGYEGHILEFGHGNYFQEFCVHIKNRFRRYIVYIKSPNQIRTYRKIFKAVRRSKSDISENSNRYINNFVENFLGVEQVGYYQLKSDRTKRYYAYVCGSDQIWNGYFPVIEDQYFLRFANQKERISFAPSFGSEDILDCNKKRLARYICSIPHLSTRESYGKLLIKDLCKKEAEVLSDPTLMMSCDEWNRIIQKEAIIAVNHDPYLLAFFLDEPSDEAIKRIKEIAYRNKYNVIMLAYEHLSLKEIGAKSFDAGPLEFVCSIKEAQFICTDSFHATAFSVIFERQFLCFKRQSKSGIDSGGRIKDFLKNCDLLDVYIENSNDCKKEKMNFDNAKKYLKTQRNIGISFLKDALQEAGK